MSCKFHLPTCETEEPLDVDSANRASVSKECEHALITGEIAQSSPLVGKWFSTCGEVLP